jgi:hypothetical protein
LRVFISLDCYIPSSSGKRSVKGGPVHVQKRGHIFAALSVVDEFPGVVDLLPGEFRFPSEFHAAAFCGLHSGAGPLADKAAFEFSKYTNHLPHRAARGRLGVDRYNSRVLSSVFDIAPLLR